MSAKTMVSKGVLVAVVLAAASLVGSVAGAAQVGGGGAGVIGAYDNAAFRFEMGAIAGQGTNPKVCVKLSSKSSDRRAEGCGPVSVWVHPTLDVARVQGTVQGQVFQARSGRSLNQTVPITLDLTYQGIGMYEPLVTGTQSRLWLYPLDVAAAQGAGLSRAAWGWGSVKAPICKQSPAVAIRNRTSRNAMVACGPASNAPAFAGTIAQTITASAGLAS
jgi:hypothetical protein